MHTNPRIKEALKTVVRHGDISVTGDRPTGPLHLGHYAGSIQTRLHLQEQCEQFIIVADMQALTDNAHNPGKIKENVLGVVADYIACGLDPARNTICLQSAIPELTELTILLMNLIPVGRLERNPTIRSEIIARGFGHSIPSGFLCYPVAQAADVIALGGTIVPVGEDQLPILETVMDAIKAINRLAGEKIIPSIQPLLSGYGRLPGIDGKSKASKSSGNTIFLSDAPETIENKIKAMYTDPEHLQVHMPGRVEGNVVFSHLDAFDPDRDGLEDLKRRYRAGGIGDSFIKKRLHMVLLELLNPIREKRRDLISNPDRLQEILKTGSEKAREKARKTLVNVKQAFGLIAL